MFDLSTVSSCAIYSADLVEFEILKKQLLSPSADYPLGLRHVGGRLLELTPVVWDADEMLYLLRAAGHSKCFAGLISDMLLYPAGVSVTFEGVDPFLNQHAWLEEMGHFEIDG